MELAKLCTVKNKYFDVLMTQIDGENKRTMILICIYETHQIVIIEMK